MKIPSKQQRAELFTAAIPYIIAFIISMGVGLIMYKLKEITPFGDKSILCMDLWGQYFPMYIQNSDHDSLGEIFYSWNGSFGYNNWAQSAYYCNSFFLLLFKFLPITKLVGALDIIALLKIAFSSVTCLGFLRYKIKSNSPILVAGAVSYSLCAYMLAFISQCMWTDSLIYVPLCLIGLEMMIREKKPLLYTLMLALTIISSFYIGFAVCIFIVLYFITLAVPMIDVTKNDEGKFGVNGLKDLGFGILRFAVFSLLAGAVSAVVIIPVGYAIGNTIASDIGAPTEFKWYGDFSAILQELLPNRPLRYEYDGANIATSVLIFVMLPMYLFNNGIKLSERLSHLAVLCFLFASLNCNYLNYMWHGFHFPNQLPMRWSFLISLMLVYLCCHGVSKIRTLSIGGTVIGLICGAALLMYTVEGHGETEGVELSAKYIVMLVIAGALILAASICARISKSLDRQVTKAESGELDENADNSDKKSSKPFNIESAKKTSAILTTAAVCCLSVLSVVQVYDSGSNFVKVSELENCGMRVSDGASYSRVSARNRALGDRWKSGKDDFYRVELNSGYTFNPSMISGAKGIGYYSSTMQGSVFKLLRFLGNRVYAENVSSVYSTTSPVQNGLFGVKYILDVNKNYGNLTSTCHLVKETEECNIWQNPTCLPVAYACARSIQNLEVTDQIRAIRNQNDLLNAVCGRYVEAFTQLDCASFGMSNAKLDESSDWNSNFFYRTDIDRPVEFFYTYRADQDGDLYVEHNYRAGSIEATYEDGSTKSIPVGGERCSYLGRFAEGESVDIHVSIEGYGIGCCGLNVYRFDETAWEGAYSQLMEQAFKIEKFNTTSFKGTINKQRDGLVMTTIPQDGGWSAYCDGKKLDTIKVLDTFMAFEVPEGEHQITMKYHVPGFAIGLVITIVGLALTILLSFPKLWMRFIPKDKLAAFFGAKDEESDEDDDDDEDSDDEEEYEDDDDDSEYEDENDDSDYDEDEEDEDEVIEEEPEPEPVKPANKKRSKKKGRGKRR